MRIPSVVADVVLLAAFVHGNTLEGPQVDVVYAELHVELLALLSHVVERPQKVHPGCLHVPCAQAQAPKRSGLGPVVLVHGVEVHGEADVESGCGFQVPPMARCRGRTCPTSP